MTKYLKDDNRIPEDARNAVEQIEWHLKDENWTWDATEQIYRCNGYIKICREV